MGVLLVALPDDDRRVLTFSETHGPSWLDMVGSLILTISWLPVPILAWRWRKLVRAFVWAVAAGLAAVGAAALYVTISRDLGWWWLPSAAAIALAQLLPVLYAGSSGRAAAQSPSHASSQAASTR